MIFNDSPTAQWNFQLLLNYWILSTDPKKSFNLYFEYFSWFMLNRSFNRCQNCFRVRLSTLNINFFIENMITFVNCRRGGPKTIARYEVDYIQKSKTIKGSFKNRFFLFWNRVHFRIKCAWIFCELSTFHQKCSNWCLLLFNNNNLSIIQASTTNFFSILVSKNSVYFVNNLKSNSMSFFMPCLLKYSFECNWSKLLNWNRVFQFQLGQILLTSTNVYWKKTIAR